MKQTTFTQDNRGLTSATQLVIALAVILSIAVLYLTKESWRGMLDYMLLFFIIMVVTGTYIGYSLVAAGRGRGTTLGIWDILFLAIASGLFIIVLLVANSLDAMAKQKKNQRDYKEGKISEQKYRKKTSNIKKQFDKLNKRSGTT